MRVMSIFCFKNNGEIIRTTFFLAGHLKLNLLSFYRHNWKAKMFSFTWSNSPVFRFTWITLLSFHLIFSFFLENRKNIELHNPGIFEIYQKPNLKNKLQLFLQIMIWNRIFFIQPIFMGFSFWFLSTICFNSYR